MQSSAENAYFLFAPAAVSNGTSSLLMCKVTVSSQPPTCLPPAGNDAETHQIDQADCIKMYLQSSIEHKFGEH